MLLQALNAPRLLVIDSLGSLVSSINNTGNHRGNALVAAAQRAIKALAHDFNLAIIVRTTERGYSTEWAPATILAHVFRGLCCARVLGQTTNFMASMSRVAEESALPSSDKLQPALGQSHRLLAVVDSAMIPCHSLTRELCVSFLSFCAARPRRRAVGPVR
jgi:hypothetical protein